MDEKRKQFEADNLVRMGMNQYQKFNYEQAKRCFLKALERDPDNKVAKEYLDKMGIEAPPQMKKKQPRKKKSESAKGDSEVERELILPVLRGSQLIAEVRTVLEKVKPEIKKGDQSQVIEDSRGFYKLGLEEARNDRFESAINIFLQAIRFAPHLAENWSALTMPLYYLGYKTEAESAVKKAVKIDDNVPRVWLDYGALLFFSKRLEEAKEKYEKALQIDPASMEAWSNLGNYYQITERLEDAEKAFRKALQCDPSSETWLALASLLDRMDRRDEAEEAYEQYLELYPEKVGQVRFMRDFADRKRRGQ